MLKPLACATDFAVLFFIQVTGEANFTMPRTRLTVGGFTQPGVAGALIELPSNAEKGLSHRFIWLFLKPLFGKFSTLGEVDKEFQLNMGKDNSQSVDKSVWNLLLVHVIVVQTISRVHEICALSAVT